MLAEIVSQKYKDKKFWISTVTGGVLLICILNGLSRNTADPDLWGYLAFGRIFWENGWFPYDDVFSYVPTLKPMVYHEWLTGVIYYPLYKETGALGLQFLRYLLAFFNAGLIYLTSRKRGGSPFAAAVSLGTTILGLFWIGYSPVRAQIFTYCFFTLTLYLLERVRQSWRWRELWIIPIIMIPWCNIHGGFVSGLGLIGLYALGDALVRRPFWPYLRILFLSGIATLINPYGIKYWSYLLHAVTMPRPEITEWAPIFQLAKTKLSLEELIYVSIVIFISLLVIWGGKRRDVTVGLTLGVTLFLGLTHARHMSFVLILVGAYSPVLLTPIFQEILSGPRLMNWRHRLGWKIPILLISCWIGLGVYKFLGSAPFTLQTPSHPPENRGGFYYPVAAMDFIHTHRLSGNLLIHFNWGEYAIWNLFPQCRVALDGRYETVYSDSVSQEYFDFINGRNNWRQFPKHYPPDMILVSKPSEIYSLLEKESHWRQVFTDSHSALFSYERSLPSEGNPDMSF